MSFEDLNESIAASFFPSATTSLRVTSMVSDGEGVLFDEETGSSRSGDCVTSVPSALKLWMRNTRSSVRMSISEVICGLNVSVRLSMPSERVFVLR
jgi:hypothetical protein